MHILSLVADNNPSRISGMEENGHRNLFHDQIPKVWDWAGHNPIHISAVRHVIGCAAWPSPVLPHTFMESEHEIFSMHGNAPASPDSSRAAVSYKQKFISCLDYYIFFNIICLFVCSFVGRKFETKILYSCTKYWLTT